MRNETFNLLYKEIRLCLMPLHYVLLLAISMLLIPSYPRYVPFFYIALGEFWMFNAGALNNDVQYSLALPIRKRDIVKSRCLLAACYEAAAVALSVPFAAAQTFLRGMNSAGIEANVAFYGFVLIVMTAFHFVFFTQFYKTGERPGLPFLFGSISFWTFYALCEFPVWLKDSLPAALFAAHGTSASAWNASAAAICQILDKTDAASQIAQLPLLAAGLAVYAAGWIATYAVSARRFERADT